MAAALQTMQVQVAHAAAHWQACDAAYRDALQQQGLPCPQLPPPPQQLQVPLQQQQQPGGVMMGGGGGGAAAAASAAAAAAMHDEQQLAWNCDANQHIIHRRLGSSSCGGAGAGLLLLSTGLGTSCNGHPGSHVRALRRRCACMCASNCPACCCTVCVC
jgi:Mrp family chromosome partitioning ATPase